MLGAIEIEHVGLLDLVDATRPVYYGTMADLEAYLTCPDPAFFVMPLPDHALNSLKRNPNPALTVVCTSKKDVTALKKKNITVRTVDCSVATVLKSASRVSPLTRASMAVSNLPVHAQLATAYKIALLGESRETVTQVVSSAPENRGFAIQEAFLSMDLGSCLALMSSMPDKDAPAVAGLLLSGHTLAFALKDSSVKAATAAGFNAYYAQKIQGMSTKYVRKVNFDRVTELLSGFMGGVKSGLDPVRSLKRLVSEALVA